MATGSAIIKAKHLSERDISLGNPRAIVQCHNNFTFPVAYKKKPSLTIQLPRCQIFEGVYESSGKFYSELLVPFQGATASVYLSLCRAFERLVKRDARFQHCTFSTQIRKSLQDCACLRVKLPQNRSQIITDIFDVNGDKLSLSSYIKGASVLPIVAVEYVYVIDGIIGFNLLLQQAVILSEAETLTRERQ